MLGDIDHWMGVASRIAFNYACEVRRRLGLNDHAAAYDLGV
jgi:hypothetical protein